MAVWRNPDPGAAGHLAIVKPGSYSDSTGATIAQAGDRNFNEGTAREGFGNRDVRYYVHK